MMPIIIKFSKKLQLFDVPNARKIHIGVIPTFGGIGLFFGIFISFILWSSEAYEDKFQYLIFPIFILFLSGIKDDLHCLSYRQKLVIQIFCSLFLVHVAKVKITSFFGLFGIEDLGWSLSTIFSTFVIIIIINSINLVDGIDGLASSIGLVASNAFGFWFLVSRNYDYAVLALCTSGALLAFFWYNRNPARIFMGDTGSSVLGSVIGVLTIQFIKLNRDIPLSEAYKVQNVPVVAISVLIIPLLDLARIFLVRILTGKSPFAADRNHIHHLFIDLGFSQMQTVAILFSFNIFIISVSLFLGSFPVGIALMIILGICIAVLIILHILKSIKFQKGHLKTFY